MNDTPTQSEPFPATVLLTTVIAAAIASALWIGCYLWFGYPYIAGVLIGFVVGFAIRLSPPSRHRIVPVLAVGLTILSALIGFVWTDQVAVPWKPGMEKTIAESIVRFFKIIEVVIFTGIGCYVAYTLATRNT